MGTSALENTAEAQAQRILDYLYFDLENAQAAYRVEQDMKETAVRLSHAASSSKLCDDPELRSLGYRIIHLKRYKFFMLYKIVAKRVYVVGIYHDLQDCENALK